MRILPTASAVTPWQTRQYETQAALWSLVQSVLGWHPAIGVRMTHLWYRSRRRKALQGRFRSWRRAGARQLGRVLADEMLREIARGIQVIEGQLEH
jgi:hypothetical protein